MTISSQVRSFDRWTSLLAKNMPKGIYKHKPLSEETKRKLSKANKGRKLSEITKKRISEAHKGIIFTEEHRKKISKNMKGSKNHQFGKKQSEETIVKRILKLRGQKRSEEVKRKMSLSKKGIKTNRVPRSAFKKGQKPWNAGKKTGPLSLEIRLKMANSHKGKKCNFWKGGITPLAMKIRKSFEYRQWRSDIYTKDDFTCQLCNIKGYRLHAHHIKLFSLILKEHNIKKFEEALDCEELWNINNGKTLCIKCHKIIHNKKIK